MNAAPGSMAARVTRAQAGDVGAWTTIVEEFQDVAVGLAAGWSGDWTIAEDVAQDAFVTAFLHLSDLADPQAFPAWFARIVRSAMTRHLRRERRPLSSALREPADADPGEAVVGNEEAQRLRRAVEALPERERAVVALHYLGGLAYPEVAEMLGIGVSAAKKRAASARRHLEEKLAMSPDSLSTSRPSRSPRLRNTVAFFLAIRRRDHALVRELLAADPTLVSATERWSKDEAMELGLQNAEDGTPLVRAAQTGDAELVQLLLHAGASPNQPCRCPGAESALWTATLYGETAIVAVLLAAGADPNAAAFAGTTPLVIAAQRGHHEITRLLTDAGADPSIADHGGRTAPDWSAGGAAGANASHAVDLVPTGVRSLDLFAPIRRGASQWWPAAWELGQFALLTEIVRSIAPGEFWQLGFSTGSYNEESGRQWLRQFPVGSHLRLTAEASSPADRRAHFDRSLRELEASSRDKIAMLMSAPGHRHDITLAVARLRRDRSVLTTIVIEPATAEANGPRPQTPEGFDNQVSFDPWRAVRGLWPALDPLRSTAAGYPSERHAHLAASARSVIRHYQALDPELERREPESYPDAPLAARAQALHSYLTQPFVLWEHATGIPGESTAYRELLDSIEALLQ